MDVALILYKLSFDNRVKNMLSLVENIRSTCINIIVFCVFNSQRCIPGFENAAFGLEVEATNTCGKTGSTEFCVQSGSQVTKKTCDLCTESSHSPYYMTDFSSYANRTWWQSETMYESVQYPNQVNLTLHFGT